MAQGGTRQSLSSRAQILTPAQLDEIAEIAYAHEPDWDEVYETGWHDWCGQTSRAVCAYLESEGIEAQVVDGGFCGNAHAWVELSDGTIVDPTIRQYIDRTDEHTVDEEAVPWAQVADGECLIAVIPPDHPFGRNYVK